MRLPSGEIATSLNRVEATGAAVGVTMDNLVTDDGLGGELLHNARPAMTTTSAVMLHGTTRFLWTEDVAEGVGVLTCLQ